MQQALRLVVAARSLSQINTVWHVSDFMRQENCIALLAKMLPRPIPFGKLPLSRCAPQQMGTEVRLRSNSYATTFSSAYNGHRRLHVNVLLVSNIIQPAALAPGTFET